jgi:hypothetical protein
MELKIRFRILLLPCKAAVVLASCIDIRTLIKLAGSVCLRNWFQKSDIHLLILDTAAAASAPPSIHHQQVVHGLSNFGGSTRID